MADRFVYSPRSDPEAGPQRRWQQGEIEAMTDAQIDKLLAEHWGFDHKGVRRQCTQEIHFCIDDYGPPSPPRIGRPPGGGMAEAMKAIEETE